MTSITGTRQAIEYRLSRLRGELNETREEVRTIEESVSRLSSLHQKISDLERAIAAAETLILHDAPEWKSEKVKAVRPRVWKGPFKSGEIGRTALTVLRESGEWMRPLDVARAMLTRIGHDPEDRAAREKLTNTVGGYFKKHRGDLVEPRGDYAKEWRVIR